jgi:hypothetical protein
MLGIALTTLVAGKSTDGEDSAAEQPVVPRGPSFRVETEVFAGESVQPAARHLVLFDSGVIYDFRLDNDRFVTMYDPVRGRVVMVDRRDMRQTIVATEDLITATGRLRSAVSQEGKADRFGLNAVVNPVAQSDLVSPGIQSPAIFEIAFADTRYLCSTQTVRAGQIARSYNHFATLAAQLNVLQGLGAPPFARMTLGQHIADQGLLPLETVLEVKRGLQKERWKSQLQLVEQLSTLDRERIASFGAMLSTCEVVSLESFGK